MGGSGAKTDRAQLRRLLAQIGPPSAPHLIELLQVTSFGLPALKLKLVDYAPSGAQLVAVIMEIGIALA
jgi:hypothetical protein